MTGMDFLSDEEVVILSDEEEELTPEEKRDLRLVRCGQFLGCHVDPLTGNLVSHPSYCNLWRDNGCPHCFQRRLRWLRGRVLHAIMKCKEREEKVRVLLADGDEIKDIASNLDKRDYLRLPSGDSKATLFVHGSASEAGTEITYEDAVKMNWPEYINTPEGQRISGGLGRDYESEEEDGESGNGKSKAKKVAIGVPMASPKDVTSEEKLAAWGKALKRTPDFDPHTVEELEEALLERTREFIRAIREAGGGLSGKGVGIRKRYVDLARIDWKRSYALNMEEARFELEKGEGIPF